MAHGHSPFPSAHVVRESRSRPEATYPGWTELFGVLGCRGLECRVFACPGFACQVLEYRSLACRGLVYRDLAYRSVACPDAAHRGVAWRWVPGQRVEPRLRLKKRSRERYGPRANSDSLSKVSWVRVMPSLNQKYYSSRNFSGKNI